MYKQKLRAAGLHFCCCLIVGIVVLLLVYFGWYPGILSETQGVGRILLIVLGADVILGPLLTFIVYRLGKSSLKFDLSVIAAVQLGFLFFGLQTVYQGRPAFLVFSVDRFEAVAVADWPVDEVSKASKFATINWLGPTVVAAPLPTDPVERNKLIFETASGGADVAQIPRFYASYEGVVLEVVSRLQSIDALRKLNPERQAEISSLLAKLNLTEDSVGFLPLKGKAGDATVILESRSGKIIGYFGFKPWP